MNDLFHLPLLQEGKHLPWMGSTEPLSMHRAPQVTLLHFQSSGPLILAKVETEVVGELGFELMPREASGRPLNLECWALRVFFFIFGL